MRVLGDIQQLLAGIYDLAPGHDVRDFLVTRRARLPKAARIGAAEQDEVLLVAALPGELAVSLFLDAAVLRRLERHDPLRRLDGDNLADWWTALEGVSHFLYVVHNANHDRAVDRLELELQAEVDKYIATLWLLRAQSPAHLPLELHSLLFARTRIDPLRAGVHFGLYAAASHQASRFCRSVERGLARARAAARAPLAAAALTELRRFYRWSSRRKLEHIAALA
jgi:hypothetical protein